MIEITGDIEIDPREIEESFIRASAELHKVPNLEFIEDLGVAF